MRRPVNIASRHELEIVMTRRYRMKLRAERKADTRGRIVAAAAHLHRTLGPDRTTISDIARLAGVERPTVLRHFPDRLSLAMACLLPGLEQDPTPDPARRKLFDVPRARPSRPFNAH